MDKLIKTANSSTFTSFGLLLFRVVLGIVFINHGSQKFFEWTLAGTAASFEQMGVPAPAMSAAVVASVELFGGILLILGLATRIVAALQAGAMTGAMIMVHLPQGFSASNGGYEYVLVLAAGAALFIFTGAGKHSIDRFFVRKRLAA
ncbi:MAG: DoxX family protein [Rothia sp. (in: high G+C Gram-positive bacteria)]|uniref:DoxX family protein n=1 Tax=Rothia sp. (in: high G+C Gram-positive bacteria) TaxID=1885016 RepID=UPI0026DFB35C|nr:DoxX family protein [Rothia sp. (in: high G+C Gram-positive bacteria)]MDO5750062.1 DoxX family protein [Rothia sp. (in: high G+C Gram-positive bacteria)]